MLAARMDSLLHGIEPPSRTVADRHRVFFTPARLFTYTPYDAFPTTQGDASKHYFQSRDFAGHSKETFMDDANDSPSKVAADSNPAGHNTNDKTVRGTSDAKPVVTEAVASGQVFAKDALEVASKNVNALKSQLVRGRQRLTEAINDEPVKAVLITVVVSSLLTALLLSARRSDGR